MQKVFVLDKNKKPLVPSFPPRGKEHLTKGNPAVFRTHPFTILLKAREGGATQEIEVKIDLESKTTGLALVGNFPRARVVIWAANLHHIDKAFESRVLPITFRSNGRTKYNRTQQSYEKNHWIDAPCKGETGEEARRTQSINFLDIKAIGRGSRQFFLMDKYGFPKTSAKKHKTVHGFKTADLVKSCGTTGKKSTIYTGRVAVRCSGYFCVEAAIGKVDGISYTFCKSIQCVDGYNYTTNQLKRGAAFPSHPKVWGLHAVI